MPNPLETEMPNQAAKTAVNTARYHYYAARRAHRSAVRAYEHAQVSLFSTPQDIASAKWWMDKTRMDVPGGLSRSATSVILEGWVARRLAVSRKIIRRQVQPVISGVLEQMERFIEMKRA